MLHWISLLTLLLLVSMWFLLTQYNSTMHLVISGELILLLLTIICFSLALQTNLVWCFGFGFILLMVGSLELALNLILFSM